MTKEELEKEAIFYAENIIPADTNYYLTKRYSKEQIQQAYLAGLKAGSSQWHDLRKDQNDLPNDDRIVSDQEGDNVRYVKHLNKWFYRHRTCEANVIAWCEIPQFKE